MSLSDMFYSVQPDLNFDFPKCICWYQHGHVLLVFQFALVHNALKYCLLISCGVFVTKPENVCFCDCLFARDNIWQS